MNPPPKKKSALEKLLGGTFSVSGTDSSLCVSLNELTLAEVSRYKSEPILDLNESSLEWW